MEKSLIEAYRETEYRITENDLIILRVDEPNSSLDHLLTSRKLTTAAYLTAWNPYSQPTSLPENEAAQKELLAEIKALGLNILHGEGVGLDNSWPPEPSFLVLAIDRDQAERLSRKFRQNAFIWLSLGKGPELALTDV